MSTENRSAEEQGRELPITFGAFIISLASSAMVHLGEAPDPVGGTTEKNIPLARQTIALLEILETKTRGNLDDEEARLLSSVLYELRMRFLQASRSA